MTVHELKTWPSFFEDVWNELKTFDIRDGKDRDFKVGDVLRLLEYMPETKQYTGRQIDAKVTYLLKGEPFLPESLVCMSIKVLLKVGKNDKEGQELAKVMIAAMFRRGER